MKTLAQELADESERLRRRMVHATRPKRPMTLDEARRLHEAMIASSDLAYEIKNEG